MYNTKLVDYNKSYDFANFLFFAMGSAMIVIHYWLNPLVEIEAIVFPLLNEIRNRSSGTNMVSRKEQID